MDVEFVSCLFELPPSDQSISRSFNYRYDICWDCIAALEESYSCGNALRAMAIFRLSLIFLSADCSLNKKLSALFRIIYDRSTVLLVFQKLLPKHKDLVCSNLSKEFVLQLFPYFESSPVFLRNDHLQKSIIEVHNDFLSHFPLKSISASFANISDLHLGLYLQHRLGFVHHTGKMSGFPMKISSLFCSESIRIFVLGIFNCP